MTMKISPSPEMVFGETALESLPAAVKRLGARTILITTGRTVSRTVILDQVRAALAPTGCHVVVVDDVEPEPEIRQVGGVVELARREQVDAVIGLGGGSSIDFAKVVAALTSTAKPIQACFGIDQLETAALPIIAIPTTAGTGSEVTPIAILSDGEARAKKGIVSSAITPRYAFLVPSFTVSVPPHITAMTGVDALCHAIEAFTSVNASEYSDPLALRAIRLISRNLETAFREGANLDARGNMLMGSMLAGMAFAQAGVTAVHAFAYPLGGIYHLPHGLANSLMLRVIMEHNLSTREARFAEIAIAMGGGTTAADAVATVVRLCRRLQLPENLGAAGIPQAAIPELAREAMKVTRLLANNPAPVTLDDAVRLYTRAF